MTQNGFKQKFTTYQAHNCKSCPIRDVCNPPSVNRQVDIIAYRKRRPADIEPVFANIKHNKNFRCFMLRGLRKVEVETGLLAIAHNLAKMAA